MCFFYWFIDSAWSYLSFENNLKNLIFKEPVSWVDTFLLKVSPYQIVSRLIVIALFTILGSVILEFFIKRLKTEAAFRESEKKFRELAESLPQVVFEMDDNSNITYVNRNAFDLFGYTQDDFNNGLNALEMISPGDRDRAIENIQRRFNGEELSNHEYTAIRKNGSIIPVEIHLNPIIRENSPVCYRGLMIDITDRKQAKAALKESEKRYQELIKNIPVGVYRNVPGPHGGFLIANPAIAKMFGYDSTEEFLNVRVVDLYKDSVARQDFTEKLALQGQVFGEELLLKKRDGTIIYGAVTAQAVRGNDDKIAYFDGYIEDISERKRVEEALLKSEKKFRNIYENAQIGLFRTRLSDGLFLEANQRLVEMFGYMSRDELIGQLYVTDYYVEPEIRARMIAELREKGEIGNYEACMKKKDGSIWWARYSGTLYEKEGYFEGVIADITESKQAEMEKTRLEEQYRQAQKMESIGQLAGGIAHDFNNMLSVILGHTEIAMSKEDSGSSIYKNLQEIYNATNRSADLTRQLLGFARKQTVAPRVLDLNETVEKMLKLIRRLIGESIDLTWIPGTAVLPVKIDPTQIDQILTNLCVNARDAIETVGKIIIETGNIVFDDDYCSKHLGFRPGKYVLLAVSDDGCGMEQKILDKIFEPFFTTKEVGRGTGLGLATVYGIVKQNNGFINIYSEPGRGTTAKIYLPIQELQAEHIETGSQILSSTRNIETVLVVEDELSILEMITGMLEHKGFKVLAASTPNDAIRMAEEHDGVIHLLLTDVIMPQMNGRDLYKNLIPLYPKIESLFMSGYTANIIANHGVLEEGVFFIQKPFSMKDLVVKLREVLDSE